MVFSPELVSIRSLAMFFLPSLSRYPGGCFLENVRQMWSFPEPLRMVEETPAFLRINSSKRETTFPAFCISWTHLPVCLALADLLREGLNHIQTFLTFHQMLFFLMSKFVHVCAKIETFFFPVLNYSQKRAAGGARRDANMNVTLIISMFLEAC